jgi:Tat protein secretion system quality control protein TatD with DNase activity
MLTPLQVNLQPIAAAVARLRGCSEDAVKELAWNNACRLFAQCLPPTDDAE